MKKFLKFLLTVAVIVVVLFLALRLVNTCDHCEQRFFGLGYEGNIIDNAVNEEPQILCEECAELHHALALTFGKSLEEYQRELVPEHWEELLPDAVKDWLPDGE